jgi:hypothetical protein
MRARRPDANHSTIAGYFERAGCKVFHTYDAWDITVTRMGVVKLVEIKDPEKAKSRTRLTPRAQKLVDEGWPIRRCETLDDVLGIVNEMYAEALHREGMT